MAHRILLIEDEPALMRGLRDSFASKGFEVLTAMDGEAGLSAALREAPDLIVLDIMLPKVNGYEVCRAVRETGCETPIIMLTAKSQEEDVVLGLNLGADDYVVKPFKIRELLARANAFLRRSTRPASETIPFGSWELNLAARQLLRDGEPVELTGKEFGLLSYLATRPGRAVTRTDILNAVWGHSVMVTQRSVDRCVTTLRAKIEPDPPNPRFIQTVRDVGYRFEPGEG